MELFSCKSLDMNLGDVLSLNIVNKRKPRIGSGEVLEIYRLDWNTQGYKGKRDTQSHCQSL